MTGHLIRRRISKAESKGVSYFFDNKNKKGNDKIFIPHPLNIVYKYIVFNSF